MNMRIFILLTGLLLSLPGLSHAQETALQPQGKIELGFNGLLMGYEARLSQNLLLNAGVGLGSGIRVQDRHVAFMFNIAKPAPFLRGELRYFYNRPKRLLKGKDISFNTGNFVGLQTKYSFGRADDADLHRGLLTEVHWGLQRHLGGRFLYHFHVGLGYIRDFNTGSGMAVPTVGTQFSYVIF